MAVCNACGEEYSDKRAALGFTVCLTCGEEMAQCIAEQKNKQITILYNKGPYQYITEGDALMSLGRKV